MESEQSANSRIRAVLTRKNPVFWVILIAILAAVAVAICILTATNQEQEPQPDASPVPDAEVLEWLDYHNSLEMLPWNDANETCIDDFPNVMFCWTSGGVSAREADSEQLLFSGMPVITVCFADVTGDGFRDVCAAVYYGSGSIDKHIVVYDYANKQGFTLWDRGSRDYHLFVDRDRLCVGVTPYGEYEPTETGVLEAHNGVPVYCPDAASDTGTVALEPFTEGAEPTASDVVPSETPEHM